MNASDRKQYSGLSLRANFSWTFVGNVVNAGSWFAMTIVLAKLGSPEHVGQFALGLAATAPIFMFASLRLRDVQATDSKQEFLFGDYFALRLLTTALAFMVVAGIVFVSGYRGEMALVILATAASKSIEAISDALYGLFMRQERLDRIAKSMMVKGPLSLIGLGIGFYLTRSVFWGVVGMAMARAVVLVSYDLWNATLSLNSSSERSSHIISKDSPLLHWNSTILARLAWLALPLGFVTMLISFKTNIPRYFIEQYLGTYQLGLFAAAASFQKIAPTVVTALGRSASPRLAKYYAANNVKAFRSLMVKLIGISVVLGCGGVSVALVVGRELLVLFYGAEYALHGLFVLLMVAAGIDYIATMLQHGMTSARYFRGQLPVFLATTAAAGLASFMLIPTAGLEGAAIALMIAAVVRAGCSLLVVWHALHSLHKKSFTAKLRDLSLQTGVVGDLNVRAT